MVPEQWKIQRWGEEDLVRRRLLQLLLRPPEKRRRPGRRVEAGSRDGNSTRGCGYPRILNPMDAGAGLIFHPWVDPHPHPHIAGAGADLRFHPRVDPHPYGKKNHNPTYLDKVHLNYPNYKMST